MGRPLVYRLSPDAWTALVERLRAGSSMILEAERVGCHYEAMRHHLRRTLGRTAYAELLRSPAMRATNKARVRSAIQTYHAAAHPVDLALVAMKAERRAEREAKREERRATAERQAAEHKAQREADRSMLPAIVARIESGESYVLQEARRACVHPTTLRKRLREFMGPAEYARMTGAVNWKPHAERRRSEEARERERQTMAASRECGHRFRGFTNGSGIAYLECKDCGYKEPVIARAASPADEASLLHHRD